MTMISPADEAFYQELLDFTYDLAEKASKVILDGLNARWHHNAIAEEKKNTVDLVTETDQAVEKLIKEAIFAKYPSHKFIGEESYAAGERQELTDEYTWMVDPIDGTMNFVHSHPSFACSIGIAHKTIPVVGVIAQPKLGRIFSARLGGGAYMNKEHKLPLTGGIPQPLTSLRDCMVAAEWGSDRSSETIPAKVNSFMKLAGDGSKGIDGGIMVHALRTTGSSACNLVAVAAGELDIYWDNGCWPWDICAGAIIIREAGGYFTGSKRDHKEGRADGEYLMNRRYACIRPIAGKSAGDIEDQQKKLISDLYDTVQEWTLTDMS